jgi:gamma-glutamylcyclotransferase (GGCT)/AIG2-like uncharacterized protein YtfP
MQQIRHFFVYGTLKTGQCREKYWPVVPLSIQPAWTLGELYDLGPYPAMLPGTQRIAGELWTFNQADIETTRRVLDRIECTNQPGCPNEYDRVVTEVHTFNHAGSAMPTFPAETYFYTDARQLKKSAKQIVPTVPIENQYYAVWPVGSIDSFLSGKT